MVVRLTTKLAIATLKAATTINSIHLNPYTHLDKQSHQNTKTTFIIIIAHKDNYSKIQLTHKDTVLSLIGSTMTIMVIRAKLILTATITTITITTTTTSRQYN